MNAFTDVSIFQGIIEFSDENGRQYRAEGRNVSQLIKDTVGEKSAWVCLGVTPGTKIFKNPKKIWNAIQNL